MANLDPGMLYCVGLAGHIGDIYLCKDVSSKTRG